MMNKLYVNIFQLIKLTVISMDIYNAMRSNNHEYTLKSYKR